MISKTDMLTAFDRVDYKITEVLHSWVMNEGNNLESFIDNPVGHVNYNQYAIMDFDKLTYRLSLLRIVQENLRVVTEYKRGNEDVTRSMYEVAIDGTQLSLVERLLAWLIKRFADMTELISSGASGTAPTDEYNGMYTFNKSKFMAEYIMYQYAIEGCKVLVAYKKEQVELAKQEQVESAEEQVAMQSFHEEELLTSNEPPNT